MTNFQNIGDSNTFFDRQLKARGLNSHRDIPTLEYNNDKDDKDVKF